MRLRKLRLINFRVHNDSVLDLGDAKFCVIRGKNFSGKTSLAEGLSLGLTDTTWGLDKRGAGFAKKIKRGEPKATIEVDLQGANRLIHRTVNLHVNSLGRTQTSEDLSDPNWHPKKFDDLLALKKAALGVAINTRDFMNLVYSRDEDAQKNLLASLVLPARHEFEKDTISDVESVLGEGVIDFNGEPFAVIGKAYKKLFDERASVNKKVKDFVIPDALPRPQGVNSESLKTQLASLREERTKQAGERDGAAKQANEAALKRDRANAKIETLTAVLTASKEALRTLEANILPDPSAVQEVAGRKAERERLLAEQRIIVAKQEAAKKEVDRINELSAIETASCPTCDQEIDEAKFIQLMTSAIAERTRLADEGERIENAIYVVGSAEEIKDAIDKIEKHNKALEGKIEASKKVEDDDKALKDAKDEAGKHFGGLFESSMFDSAISKTDKEIETMLQQIQPVIATEEREKEIATKQEQFKKLEEKAAKLDRLTKLFDKDGIKAKLIATHIGGFESKVNSVLSAWDYSCSLSIEPFKFEVTNHRKDTSPLMDLSDAEELMFYAAFQCAVSQVAGIGFVVIDRVDTLLPELRPMLFKKLYGMITDKVLDQIILLIADTSEQVPKIPDSAFFVIEEGNIRRLG